MATYNNAHWLLSHIRNSFISTDDTGMCEAVMLSDDLPNQYVIQHRHQQQSQKDSTTSSSVSPKPPDDFHYYPGLELNDDEDMDPLSQSYDVQMVPDISIYPRARTNTAQQLEKMDQARKRASKIKNIKFDDSSLIANNCNIDKSTIFERKEIDTPRKKQTSQLTQLIETIPKPPVNKFIQYAKFDGTGITGMQTKTIKIFLTMLPGNLRYYPLNVCVISTAKIQEFIGLICYKCAMENPEIQLLSVRNYGLYITEENGEIDLDFPPLDLREPCLKFCFHHLALVERKLSDVRMDTRTMSLTSEADSMKEAILQEALCSLQQNEDMARMITHTTMIDAPVYRTYRLQILNKGLFKIDIQLGISGEKLEIDPVQQKNTKFWSRQKPISHSMDSVAWCLVLDSKQSRSTFRIVYCPPSPRSNLDEPSSSPLRSSTSFKHYDFETDAFTAQEIVEKINNITEVRSNACRREYLAAKDKRKGLYGKKTFSFK